MYSYKENIGKKEDYICRKKSVERDNITENNYRCQLFRNGQRRYNKDL